MNMQKLEHYRKKLLKSRKETEALIKGIEESGLDKTLRDSVQELSAYDNHPADLGDELFERSKDLALRDRARLQLQKIDDALQRIEEGRYGYCENCGRPIPEERLEVVPETTLCVNCRRLSEGKGDRHPRPIEEDVVVPPYGGFTHDSSPAELGDAEDEVMYDGEDAWQDVARFGTSDTPQDAPHARDYPAVYPDFDEDRGVVQDVEGIPYFKGADGIFYENVYGQDNEEAPEELVIGDDGLDMLRREDED
ncbi:TraR/DksA C4-type zinc finger protein [Calderihabitans maritimus]|uniref:TraR/DksA family transcriptional regulator n=1 Tax=Calderihabitans maritimus TaxID=1246530 RepID=A0A1Z5HSU2_9FIRM|nr:TraR/DksA C4-type zinc finger protein [Calderihabitans maritimus]GAW92602.1 TraR/DksA family transcriptional regulator [Calderihabitans maritimus]